MTLHTKTRNQKIRGRMALWLAACSIGFGTVVAMPPAARAADADMKEVAEAKVPAPVTAAARAVYLDSRDVIYRREEGTKKYDVNFTTPTNIRLQIEIKEDGTVTQETHLAPNQPAGAPKRAERDALLAQWNQRVMATKAVPVAPPVTPAVPVPPAIPAVPPAPGALPPLPVQEVETPVSAADLPPAVLQSLDRYTSGGTDISYLRQTGGQATHYEANYTHSDGTRREVSVAENGSLLAGPLVMRETITDSDLAGDKGTAAGAMQPSRTERIEAKDVPARAMAAFSTYAQTGATDVRYRRDTYADKSLAYTQHWIRSENNRRYFTTVKADGTVTVPPQLSIYQPDAMTDAKGQRWARIPWPDVPAKVQPAFATAKKDPNAAYYKLTQGPNKGMYNAVYTEGGKKMSVMADEAGKVTGAPMMADKPGVKPATPATPKAPVTPEVPKATRGIPMADLPKAVQASIDSHAGSGTDIVTMKTTEGGKTVYRTSWVGADKKPHEMRLDEKGEMVGGAPAKK